MEQHIGISKAAPVLDSPQPMHEHVPMAQPPIVFEGMPLEMIRYFDIDVRQIDNRIRKQIMDIYTFSCQEGDSIGDILLKVRAVEKRLGVSSLNETRYGRIWNWLKINRNIEELHKQRSALEKNQ